MLDELGLIFFFICVLIYVMVFGYRMSGKKPSKISVLNLIYKNWVKNRLNDDPIVAVQALRNFIMGSSTFVSALFLLLGIFVGFYNVFLFNKSPFWGLKTVSLGHIQIILNILLIIYCLFNFILAVRFGTRLSLLITGNPENYSIGNIEGINLTTNTFKSAINHWMFGVRGLFFLVAAMLWFLNAIFFIIATFLVTTYLVLFQEIWIFSKGK